MSEKKVSQVYAAGVLAGRYHGKSLSERALLLHAVSDSQVNEGRLRREPGEAFCDKKIELVDQVVWEGPSQISCPRCKEIVSRIVEKQVPAPGDVKAMRDRNGDLWQVRLMSGVTFLEDENGERYSLNFIEKKFGPLTSIR